MLFLKHMGHFPREQSFTAIDIKASNDLLQKAHFVNANKSLGHLKYWWPELFHNYSSKNALRGSHPEKYFKKSYCN